MLLTMSCLGKELLMAELVLISPGQRSLRSLVEAALHNELRLLQAGIRRTEQRLQAFETQYGMSSAAFVQRYENDALQETLDFAEWVGEYRLLERLREKMETIQNIHIAD
jgi:phage shock protein A